MANEDLAAIKADLEARDREWRTWAAERDAESSEREKESRRYMDEMLRRHAVITETMIAAMQDGFAALISESKAMQAEIADQRAQIRANTEAVLRVLDRRDGADPA